MGSLALVAEESLAHSLSFPDSMSEDDKDLGLSSPSDCSPGRGDHVLSSLFEFSEIDELTFAFPMMPLDLGDDPRVRRRDLETGSSCPL